MSLEIIINRSRNADAGFIGWAPLPAVIRYNADAPGGNGATSVTIRNRSQNGGQVIFLNNRAGGPADAQPELEIDVPNNGDGADFFIAGRFGFPSTNPGDAEVEVEDDNGNIVLTVGLMVRIRKNAATLTPEERDRFLNAFGTLNQWGRFQNFRDMHIGAGLQQAHGDSGFLPWHRAYLLDLERELQRIDRSVALPYWRFDQPAPNLFTAEFMGESTQTGRVRFSPGHPFNSWSTDGNLGINRTPRFNSGNAPNLFNEFMTIGLGDFYEAFMNIEGNPHGTAHVSFNGDIRDANTAPKDPLFFLLHNNVDRLWAKWQWVNNRFDGGETATFINSQFGRPGHNLNDTMWPWNQVTGGSRPNNAPGGRLATRPSIQAPGTVPTVGDMIDYQGILDARGVQGFDYDDVPFMDLEV